MYVSNNSSVTQSRAFSNTGKIGGVSLPDFDSVFVYTKKKSDISDSDYEKAIVEQAAKDQATEKFQNESQGFNTLAKRYVSEVSPDRKNIITTGLHQITKNKVDSEKPLNYITLLLKGKVKYQKDSANITYAEFYDSNGEMVATYSNGGWTMLSTQAETARQIDMCSIYNRAWNAAAKANQGSNGIENSTFHMLA